MISSMLSQMCGPAHGLQILDSIIELVPVDVVDDAPLRQWAMHRLPHMDGPQLPHVGFGDLHEPPRIVPALASTEPFGPDGQMVRGPGASLELGSRRPSGPFGRRAKRTALNGCTANAVVRAIVNWLQFAPLPVEGLPTNRAVEILAKTAIRPFHAMDSTGSSTLLEAWRKREELCRLLDTKENDGRERVAETRTSAMEPPSGTARADDVLGRTGRSDALVGLVPHTHTATSPEAIGIELHESHVDLICERCGMFLEVA